ncbi:unnamed protein product [Urochloa decumbens]|uniref:Stomagen C-terminal domain-containing protein n=1 Tax=Urochloa decumbens TaxID=240449 RepID=A0ABC9C716_9POAL
MRRRPPSARDTQMAAAAENKQRQQLRYVLLCRLLLVAVLVIGDAVADAGTCSPQMQHAGEDLPALKSKEEQTADGGTGRRMLVGSRAPTCTYNECRGCRHRCSIQEVPIDASDPINSAYHYKCICHL